MWSSSVSVRSIYVRFGPNVWTQDSFTDYIWVTLFADPRCYCGCSCYSTRRHSARAVKGVGGRVYDGPDAESMCSPATKLADVDTFWFWNENQLKIVVVHLWLLDTTHTTHTTFLSVWFWRNYLHICLSIFEACVWCVCVCGAACRWVSAPIIRKFVVVTLIIIHTHIYLLKSWWKLFRMYNHNKLVKLNL